MARDTLTNRMSSSTVTSASRWDQQGLDRRNLALAVCALRHNWSVIANRLGGPRLARDWGVTVWCFAQTPRPQILSREANNTTRLVGNTVPFVHKF